MAPPVASLLHALPGDADAVCLRDGERWVVGVAPDRVLRVPAERALGALETLESGWWAGWLTYDFGRAVERVIARPRIDDGATPDVVLARFPARAVVDPNGPTIEIVGEGPARRLLVDAVARTGDLDPPPAPSARSWHTGIERDAYEAAVRAVVELIRAGDCYQVNLTRRLTTDEPIDPLALFATLVEQHPAPHGAFARLGDTTVVSASPERFLRLDGRAVSTRPIKGTAPDAGWLAGSAKDRAENVMIVDLARNDLGRVCEFGSIAVPGLCEIEAHPGLYHLTSTVTGRLRPDVGVADLLAATCPAASITGAPKPRVMQIIEDLEPVRRGVYCGAIGWIDLTGAEPALDFNVAIRTFVSRDGLTHLGVGGGVVADSEPGAEWDETVLKAERLLAAAGAGVLVGS